MVLSNRDIVNMERYLESCVKSYDIPYLNSFSISISSEYDDSEKYIRVSLYYDDLIIGRDIIQPRMKEIIKKVLELDDIRLERCYEACSKNEENMYEILYNVPKNIYKMIEILSRIN